MADKHKPMSSLTAALVGAAFGAGAAILSKRENRTKLKAKVNELMEVSEEKMGAAQEKAEEVKEKGRKKVASELKKAQRKLENGNASKRT